MSADKPLPPSAYIPFGELPREFDALQARYDVLFREYRALSARAAHLERELIRYLTSDWSVVRTQPETQHTEHRTTDLGDRNARQH